MSVFHILSHVYSVEERSKSRGWTVFNCPVCQTVRPVHLVDIYQKEKVCLLPVSDSLAAQYVACDFCDSVISIKRSAPLPADMNWVYSEGLQSLVDRTRPEFGKVSEPEPPSDIALNAFLNSLSLRKAMSRSNQTAGVFLGIGTMILVVLLLVICGFNLNGFEFLVYVFLLIGGGIAGALIYALIRGSRITVAIARDRIIRYKVDLDRLALLAEKKGRFVRSIIADFREKK